MAEALYRKYRPQVFGDVVGQDHIERTIKNAIGQDKVSHAYLFCGPRGTGKTTTARLLAKALLCEHGPTADPDGTCENCLEIARGEHPDVYELDAASRTGVENVREEIIGRVQFAPTRGRYKVYIIDEVHMLSTAAFNALLKTLEEPPDHVVFILCTTDPQKVPETIHSRCQRFDFHRISNDAIVARLGAICIAEDVEFEGDALDLIAYRAEGGMRDALTSLEQLIAFGEGKVTLELAERLLGSLEVNDMAEIVRAIGQRDIATCFQWTANYVDTGSDLAQFVRDLAQHIRNMYILSLAGNDVPLEISEAVRRELIIEMEYFGQDRLTRLLGVLGDLAAELKTSSNPRLSFEIALTRMVRPDSDLTLESLAERIEALESGYSAVAHVVAVPVDTGVQVVPTPSKPVSEVSRGPVEESQDQTGNITEEPQQAQEPALVAATSVIDWSNPAVLQRTWQAVLSAVKRQKTAHGALFLNTRASFDQEAQELVIEFPNGFTYTAVQKPEILDLVKECLTKEVGSPVAFRFIQRASDANDKPQSHGASAEVAVAAYPAAATENSSDSTPHSTRRPPQSSSNAGKDNASEENYGLANEAQDKAGSIKEELQQTQTPAPQREAQPESQATPQVDSVPLDAYDVGPSDELNEILSMGFGDGFELEEVKED